MRRLGALAASVVLLAAPAVASPPASAVDDPRTPDALRAEPAGTRIETVDGTGVLFQYDHVVPSFDDWDAAEPTRDRISLDGTWSFRFDPEGRGLSDGWARPDRPLEGWDTIRVPSSWDLKDTPGFDGYDGTDFGEGTAFQDGYAWYRKTITVPRSWNDEHVRLSFLAVNYRSDVWIDGVHAGAHEGGQTPFALPVDDLLRPGTEATIAVRVDRRASFEDYVGGTGPVTDRYAVPWKPVDYWPYAGLTRSAWLEAVPRVSVAKVLVAAADGVLDARAVVENTGSRPFRGSVRWDPGRPTGGSVTSRPVTVGPGETRVVRAVMRIPRAVRWSTDDPRTYTTTAELRTGPGTSRRQTVDQLSTGYGMRSVDIAGALLQVNGDEVFLKGLNWHEETGRGGRSLTLDEYDHELGHALDLGVNLLRNSVYNRHPYAYDWADRHGVFMMDDTDNMWLNTDQQRLQTASYGLSRALAASMAWNQHNHPSVILWGLQNESEIDPDGAPVYRAWLRDMKDAILALDLQHRPVTWASSTTDDPAFDIADVIGFNEYFGYFYGANEDLGPALDGVHARHPDTPLLITENGSWSYLGRRGSALDEGTEDWQAANLESHWDQATERPFVAGYTYWVLKDYKQRAGYNADLNGISVMGLLGWDSTTRRLAYDVYRDVSKTHDPAPSDRKAAP
ncbi:glycoside hydrolase family 2 TIM barrel-domain containing protein [Isoptericola sp. F-RaC21]|uniref:glycoside hydrolase family 2 protein n=1 Tax=Isoptericola sp. F-RaC21 TaxID=3141452 RepID=UPI00315BB308